jgi:transposase
VNGFGGSRFALDPPYQLIALYARLTGRGKPHKAALTACARKLLIYANTVVQRQTPWTEKTTAI